MTKRQMTGGQARVLCSSLGLWIISLSGYTGARTSPIVTVLQLAPFVSGRTRVAVAQVQLGTLGCTSGQGTALRTMRPFVIYPQSYTTVIILQEFVPVEL
jgi:hypothetical protein